MNLSDKGLDDMESGAKDRLPGLPIIIDGITYSVKSVAKRHERRVLLKSVSAFMNVGELTAMMGPSGSGKTTLLDIMAGRKTIGSLSGKVLIGGQVPSGSFLRHFTGYVEQFDTLHEALTVQEMLLYTADLKRPLKEPLEAKRKAVENMLSDLGLEECRDTIVGNALHRGISGGQAKRVNICVGLITNPRILFLDEPTSGLDSHTANEVVEVIKNLALKGLTVCATIHSPSPMAFQLFDRLLLLLDGQIAYFGPRGAPAITFFNNLPEGLSSVGQLPAACSEPDWLVQITTTAVRQRKASCFADHYADNLLAVDNAKEITALKKAGRVQYMDSQEASLHVLKSSNKSIETPAWWGVRTMLKYRTSRNFRSTAFLGPRIGDKFIFAFIIFTLYWGAGSKVDAGNILNICQMIFMWSILPAFSAVSYLPAIVLERPIFLRERSDGLYRVATYLVAKLVEETVLVLVVSAIFSAIVFYAVKLKGSFLLFWLVYFVTLTCGIVLAYAVASLSPSMDFGNAALPAYTIALLFFAGFLVRLENVPSYWSWFPYLDFLKYGFAAQMINHFGGENNPPFQGTTLLEYYGFRYSKWDNLGFEALFLPAFFLVAMFGLTFLKHSRR